MFRRKLNKLLKIKKMSKTISVKNKSVTETFREILTKSVFTKTLRKVKRIKKSNMKKKLQLTTQEREIWDFLMRFLLATEKTPLRKDIAKAFQISLQLVQYRLKRLEKKGLILLLPRKKRNICLRGKI
jgi:Mn-dependent DtxR family transcriptional regulator